MAIVKVCAEPGCFTRTRSSRCPEHQRAHTRRRNQRPEHRQHLTPEYRKLRARVLVSAGFRCSCGAVATECDFILPLARGGEMTFENAQAACKSCNSSRGAAVRR